MNGTTCRVLRTHAKRMAILSFLACGLFLVQCAVVPPRIESSPAKDEPHEFPAKIYFKTTHESFNSEYYFLLNEKKLYIKSHIGFLNDLSDWILIDYFPLAKPSRDSPTLRYDDIDQISVDVNKMEIVSENKIYTCNIGLSDYRSWVWDNRWGFPFAKGPGLELLPTYRGWSVSASNPEKHKYQTDLNGNKFSVYVGSIFLLSQDGTTIHLADPWAPADWGYQIATPLRGRFIARNISAGGSVVFIINDYGDMYTRYVDYDVIGTNPTLRYTYNTTPVYEGIFDRQHRRKLPIADWVRQPKIDGAISSKITVYTTGEGGDGRGLRVEGKDSHGNPGYYEKALTASNWNFKGTPGPGDSIKLITNTPEGTQAPIQGENKDFRYTGELADHPVILDDFNFFCSPSSLRIRLESGKYLQFYLHTILAFRMSIQTDPGTSESPLELKGAIEIPEALAESAEAETRDFLKKFLGYSGNADASRFVLIKAKATDTTLKLEKAGLFSFLTRLKIDFTRS